MKNIALVRPPSNYFPKCLSTHPQRKLVSLEKAHYQHEKYCETLKELGLEIIIVSYIEDFPDSCFVEDTAIIYGEKAVISKMGAISRQGEQESVKEILSQYFQINEITTPGTVEGGDVIHFKNGLLSGITQRTNSEGVKQLSNFLNISITTIKDKEIIHLKSYISYLKNGTIAVSERYFNHPSLKMFSKIIIPINEEYASNMLIIGDTVILPKEYPRSKSILEENGFNTVALDVTEFQKCDGALTCLSLIF